MQLSGIYPEKDTFRKVKTKLKYIEKRKQHAVDIHVSMDGDAYQVGVNFVDTKTDEVKTVELETAPDFEMLSVLAKDVQVSLKDLLQESRELEAYLCSVLAQVLGHNATLELSGYGSGADLKIEMDLVMGQWALSGKLPHEIAHEFYQSA